ncbi:hypothetical protein DFJ73DRAFT_967745 [Zopfochytrium polystomum]|nr:hypothetical protein DFJ73DRAFT_967745 [Zopfochytrium polystomum]
MSKAESVDRNPQLLARMACQQCTPSTVSAVPPPNCPMHAMIVPPSSFPPHTFPVPLALIRVAAPASIVSPVQRQERLNTTTTAASSSINDGDSGGGHSNDVWSHSTNPSIVAAVAAGADHRDAPGWSGTARMAAQSSESRLLRLRRLLPTLVPSPFCHSSRRSSCCRSTSRSIHKTNEEKEKARDSKKAADKKREEKGVEIMAASLQRMVKRKHKSASATDSDVDSDAEENSTETSSSTQRSGKQTHLSLMEEFGDIQHKKEKLEKSLQEQPIEKSLRGKGLRWRRQKGRHNIMS